MPDAGVRTPYTRVYTIEDGAGPANAPAFQALARALAPSVDFGGTTAIRIPDPNRYGGFIVAGEIIGEPSLPTLSVEFRHLYELSEMLRIGRKGCLTDVQVRYGRCQNPQDSAAGWEKIGVLESARITGWNPSELGAWTQGDDAVINETVPFTGRDWYEIKKLSFGEKGGGQVTREMVDIVICDSVSCGACGIPSDGCKTIFALSLSAGGSPGLPADVMWSTDGGDTVTETNITTLATNEDPDEMACVGLNLIVVSEDSTSLHYAAIRDIVNDEEVWAEVAMDFAPRTIHSRGPRFTWIGGAGGNIGFTSDPPNGVTIQDAGVATTQPINAIHSFDDTHVVAVGDSNAVVFTTNGGITWTGVTGPAIGVALNAVWMKSQLEWLVGTAGGRLFFTRDAGVNWDEIAFNGNGTGSVTDLTFATPTVGYMAHTTTAPAGRILRTVDGGYSWYVMPEEGGGNLPDNDRINALAACGENVNILYGAGLGANATDGILVKAA